MKKTMKYIVLAGMLAGTLFNAGASAAADTFPSKPVYLVAPYAAGGPVDIVTRILAKQLSDRWGKAVIVENRAGAGGNIGTAYVARARPDGYTLLVNTPAMLITPLIGPSVGFDAIKDFTPLARVGRVPALLLTNTKVPANNVKELIALAKAHPGKLNYASPGVGTSLQFAAVLFASEAGIEITHVPYKGGSQALPQLAAGDTQMMFDPITDSLPLVKSGKLRALAISTQHRSSLLPEVPTVAESGLPRYDFAVWYGVFAPAGMPAALRDQIGNDIMKALGTPEVAARLGKLGIEMQLQPPAEFASSYRAEQKQWQDLAHAQHISAH
ncbi:Bug family tripartite tricarboxylate transporter substrate binding protein [Candidimonas nitroreducens]|uniref:ABC transporter substrate-binding protein n=1 Tax=Candidimonas nitroreducens TaxID=683354 RepID=A0A225MKM8_9BURK|nr:tripartite tricarboxylate transporter substrate binding protein [Candidimonas nitroreducens]OWT61745.1 hypothetical protein CEY11_07835 [Candidimonas nitroreducens]